MNTSVFSPSSQATRQTGRGLDAQESAEILQGLYPEKRNEETLKRNALNQSYVLLSPCPAVPQLAAWHQKSLQRGGGVARTREHRDHCYPF